MSYRLIAIDLDDTLLGTDLKISPKNREAILAAVEQGVQVTIATGRMYISAVNFAVELGLDIPLITYQGGLIKESNSGDILYNQTLPVDICQKVIQACQAKGVHLQVYIDDEYYIESENEYSEFYGRNVGLKGVTVGSLDKFLDRRPNKLLIIDKPKRITEIWKEFSPIFGQDIEISASKPIFLEFTHKEATKGKALKYLSGLKDIPKDEIIAIGDGHNDVSMIDYAGLGIAMKNAPEEVRNSADYVTATNDEDGVAQAIYKFVL
ncbi:MAG: HAD family phosphatase [Clostridiales bacterium]|nr:HAD family phosphatase [Clostridiales bacterium]